MPIYEYRCDDCGTEFEKRVARAADSDTVRCPSCGERRLTQRLSTFAARATSGASASELPPCASSGACPHPHLCGRN